MVLRYIEGNPVRAGLVNSAKEWLWSSHKERIYRGYNFLIEDVPIELPVNWDRYVDEPSTGREVESLRQSVNRQCPFGDFDWQREVSKEFGLESTLRSKGRPKKGEENEKK